MLLQAELKAAQTKEAVSYEEHIRKLESDLAFKQQEVSDPDACCGWGPEVVGTVDTESSVGFG